MHQFRNVLIVLNYNDAETTIRFLEKISGLDNIDYIVVVDNHSTDDSYKKLLDHSDNRLEVVQTDVNGGYAKGNNYGAWHSIKKYNPDYILISNPDVEFSDAAIEKIENVIMGIPNSGAVTCKMKCLSGSSRPVAWKLPKYRDCVREGLIFTKKLLGDKTQYEEQYLKSSSVIKVDVVPGSFFGISRRAFEIINGFDESTFLYGEENLMASKLKKKGYQSYLLTDEEFLHEHSASIDKSVRSLYKKLQMSLNSRLIYARQVLKIKKIGEIFLIATFYVGTINYLILRKLFKVGGRTS